MEESNPNIFTLEVLCDAIQKTVDSVPTVINNPKYSDYIRIVLIGNTGVGKSTLLHILARDKMQVVCTEEDMLFVCPESKLPQIVIGGGAKSITVIPGVYVDEKNKFIFIDTPGLLDSVGVFQRILNAYSIHTVLKAGGKMKILFVIDRGAFYSKKGKNAIDNFEIISELIPDKNVLKQCLALAITKTQEEDEVMGFFNYLKSGEEEDLPWFIDYLMNDGKNEIILIPEPEDEGEYNRFTEFDKAFGILKHNPALSPKNKVVVDEDCVDQMKILAKRLKNQINHSIESFKAKVPSLYDNEKNIQILRNLDKKLVSILNGAKQGLDQFAQKVSIEFPRDSNEINESISQMKPWRDFLFEIMDDEIVSDNLLVDLSSLIDSLTGHLNNIRQLEKEHQENTEHMNQLEAKINAENVKYSNEVNNLEQKAKNNEISQEEKQRRLQQLQRNHEEQERINNNEKNRFEQNSQQAMNSILETMRQRNDKDRERLNEKIQKINDDVNKLQKDNAILQF